MLSLAQIEAACAAGEIPLLPRHDVESPERFLRQTFYPLGFPMEVRTNSIRVLEQFAQMWGKFRKRYDTRTLLTEVLFVEDTSTVCPPEPSHTIISSWLICVADRSNYCIADLESGETRITVSSAALLYPLYSQYFLFGLAISAISTCHATPIHAGCVEFKGRGFLICGDSGAGKSTLSYACAQAGWKYISDDASYMLTRGQGRSVTGNCHQVRFRPSAAELFPELHGLPVTPRAAGKPSIELPTDAMQHITTADGTEIDFVVFLKWFNSGVARTETYSTKAARSFMRQILFGPDSVVAAQHEAIERMLSAELVSLHYSDLASAIAQLERLCGESHRLSP